MSARVTLILINEEYQIMTGDIVYKDLIQLDLDVRNTDELFEVMSGRLKRMACSPGLFVSGNYNILGGKNLGWKRISIRENQKYRYYGSY